MITSYRGFAAAAVAGLGLVLATPPATAGVAISTINLGTGTTIDITGFQDDALGAGDGAITSSGALVGSYALQVPAEGKLVDITVDLDLTLVFGQTVIPLVTTIAFPGPIASPGIGNTLPVLDTVTPIALPTIPFEVPGGGTVDLEGLLLRAIFNFDSLATVGAFGPDATFAYTLTDDGASGGIATTAAILAILDLNQDGFLNGTIGGTGIITAVPAPMTAALLVLGVAALAMRTRRTA